jgi:hypothetical protein
MLIIAEFYPRGGVENSTVSAWKRLCLTVAGLRFRHEGPSLSASKFRNIRQ